MSLADAQAFDAQAFNEAVQDDMQAAYERDADALRAESEARASDQQVFDSI